MVEDEEYSEEEERVEDEVEEEDEKEVEGDRVAGYESPEDGDDKFHLTSNS